MGSGSDISYKDIVKDEKSLIKYLNDLVIRDDIDTKNKIFSACIAGRFFEFEKSLKGSVKMKERISVKEHERRIREEERNREERIRKYRLQAMGTTWEERAQYYVENQDTVGLITDSLLISNEEYILWLAKNSPDAKRMIIENCKSDKLMKKLLDIKEE